MEVNRPGIQDHVDHPRMRVSRPDISGGFHELVAGRARRSTGDHPPAAVIRARDAARPRGRRVAALRRRLVRPAHAMGEVDRRPPLDRHLVPTDKGGSSGRFARAGARIGDVRSPLQLERVGAADARLSPFPDDVKAVQEAMNAAPRQPVQPWTGASDQIGRPWRPVEAEDAGVTRDDVAHLLASRRFCRAPRGEQRAFARALAGPADLRRLPPHNDRASRTPCRERAASGGRLGPRRAASGLRPPR